MAATHAHTSSSSGTCSRLLRSDIFSLRLRVPFTFYDRSSGALSLGEILPTGIRRAKGKGRETRRRSLRWKGGRQKQHRRYLRIFPSHACMRDPLDGYAVRSISGVEIGVDFSNSPAECYSLVLRSRKCPPKVARFGGEFGREGARRR